MPDAGPAWTPDALAHDPHADAQKAAKVQAMFAAIARHYDLNNRLHSFWQDQGWRRAAVAAAGLTAQSRVLDVACGTGDLAQAFADARPASVIGVDFTPQMLEIARHKAQARANASGSRAANASRTRAANATRGSVSAPAPPSVVYEQGDAMALRFPDASFDVVSIAFGLRNVADPARALREFHRVLRPGGRVVILEFADPTNPLVRWGSDLYTKRIMPWTASLIARDRSGAYHYLPRSVSTFMQPQALRNALEMAGFSRPTMQPLSLGVCVVTTAERRERTNSAEVDPKFSEGFPKVTDCIPKPSA